MAEDLREDSGEFYPGGNVVTGVPVVPGGGGGGGGDIPDSAAIWNKIGDLEGDVQRVDLKVDDEVARIDDKLNKICAHPPIGNVYPDTVELTPGCYVALANTSSSKATVYLPDVSDNVPVTCFVYIGSGTVRFIEPLGRTLLSRGSGSAVVGGSATAEQLGLSVKKVLALTIRKTLSDRTEELIHLDF